MLLNKSNISKYLEKKDTSYKIFNIKYTKKEKEAINNFDISNECYFTYFGKMNENIIGTSYNNNNKTKIDILKFLSKIGTNTEKDIKIINNIIYKLLDKVTGGYNKNYIWLDLRISLPNNDFNLVRWHTDGFTSQSKFVSLFKGPGTLFIDDSDIKSKETYFETNDKFSKEYNKYFKKNEIDRNDTIVNKYRKIQAKKLKNAKIVQPNNNQGAIFLTDYSIDKIDKSITYPCIHSEPPNNKPRFFISVMCGTKENINEVSKRAN